MSDGDLGSDDDDDDYLLCREGCLSRDFISSLSLSAHLQGLIPGEGRIREDYFCRTIQK